jgi:hypothetical protein
MALDCKGLVCPKRLQTNNMIKLESGRTITLDTPLAGRFPESLGYMDSLTVDPLRGFSERWSVIRMDSF